MLQRAMSLAVLALLCGATPSFAQKPSAPLPGGRKGLLTVTVTAEGQYKQSNTRGENETWAILRKATFQVPLVSRTTNSWTSWARSPGSRATRKPRQAHRPRSSLSHGCRRRSPPARRTTTPA